MQDSGSSEALPGGTVRYNQQQIHKHNRLVLTTRTGYHVPAVRHRDTFYAKLEEEKLAKLKALAES